MRPRLRTTPLNRDTSQGPARVPCSARPASSPGGIPPPPTLHSLSPGCWLSGPSFRAYLLSQAPNLPFLLRLGPSIWVAHKAQKQQIQKRSVCLRSLPAVGPPPGSSVPAKGRSSFPNPHSENHRIMLSPYSPTSSLTKVRPAKFSVSSSRCPASLCSSLCSDCLCPRSNPKCL